MRNVKFKIWDKNKKRMLLPRDSKPDVDGELLISLSGKVCEYYFIDMGYGDGAGGGCEEVDDYILLQFTGLKDKNGKDIYESDIITFIEIDEDSCLGKEDKYIGKIEWIDKCAQFRCVLTDGQRRELYTIIGFQPVYDVKVIGNIYENKELLK